MVMGWQANRWRSERLERRRNARLVQRLQQAGAIDRREEVERLPSWNRMFGAIQAMRAQRKQAS